jgi:hypothetical protein
MKTPREILLGRYQAAAPKLDTIRREMVAKINHQGAKAQSGRVSLVAWYLGGLRTIWRELIFPSRRIWAGLAAIWVLLLVVNFSMSDHAEIPMAKASAPTEMMTFQQQQELLAQLMGPDEPIVAEPQKKYVPRPSSWRPFGIMTT